MELGSPPAGKLNDKPRLNPEETENKKRQGDLFLSLCLRRKLQSNTIKREHQHFILGAPN